MLGLESQLSNQIEISNLSISTKNRSSKSKNYSIHNPSTINSQATPLSNHITNHQLQTIKNLRIQMQTLTKCHQVMDIKMKTYIDIVQKQVQKKQQQNSELENMIAKLKEEIMDSRSDLEVLSNYINTKSIDTSINTARTALSHLNSKDNSNIPKNNFISNDSFVKKVPRLSPQNKPTKMNSHSTTSPMNKEEKKPILTRNFISKLEQKNKSPFK